MSFRVLNSFPDFFAVPSTTTKALFYFFIFFFSTKSTINISIRRILKCINKREVKLRLRIIVTSLRNFCSAWFHRYVLWNLLGKIRMEAKKIDFFFFRLPAIKGRSKHNGRSCHFNYASIKAIIKRVTTSLLILKYKLTLRSHLRWLKYSDESKYSPWSLILRSGMRNLTR